MKRAFLLGVLLIALLMVPFKNAVAENNVPRTINYTGNLFDYAGQPINKAVDINVKIYSSQTGGTALWTEDHRNVQVEYGYFSVNLGTETPMNLDFRTQYWVELSVNGNSYARVPFTSTPYTHTAVQALRADTADVAKEVVDKAITLSKLADEARNVTGDIVGTYPELYIKDGVVVSKIGKGQITNYHISSSVSLPPAGPAGGALTGQYPDPKLAENAVETFNILDGTVTYPKLQNAKGPNGTILVWNGYAWVESTVNIWEVDGEIGNEVDWSTNGIEILTDEDGHLGVGIMEAGVTNDMLAGEITNDKLAGDITLDKLADGYLPGQVIWWNAVQKQWQLTPNAPKENYVMKWVFDAQAGQTKLEWAEDNMSIPFFYEGASIDPTSQEPYLYSKTMFELVLDGTRGDVISGNDVHGIAVTINDTKAGSALVLNGSGMNDGNMLPIADIHGNYIGSASYGEGALHLQTTVSTTADEPSFGAIISHNITSSNLGITTFGAQIENKVEYNHYGEVYGLNVMAHSNDGSYTENKVIGINGTAMGMGSEISVGVLGTAMNSAYNVGTFGGVNVDNNTWDILQNNVPLQNIGVVAYGGFGGYDNYLYSNALAIYAYGNSQFDGEITVRDNAYFRSDVYVDYNEYVNGNLTVEQYADFNGTLNIDGLFSLDGIQGQSKEIMIGQGNGVTPVWISIANLMEDLVAGAGLVGLNYDGSVTRTFAVEYDATLKMDVPGDAGKIGLNLANANSWTALQTFATVDINGGAIDGTVIGATVPTTATFTTANATQINTVNENVTGLLTAATVDINGGAIDGTVIGASVPAVGTFTNLFATNETVSGLLTAATVDINGGNIDNTVIGAAVPTTATFTTMTATTANITNDNVTNLALTGTLKLDGVEGAVKEIMIGNGVGNTPVWITVANLMENLTDGAGIATFTYDGSAVAKVVADIDGTSLVFTDATDAAKIKINMANTNNWTALQNFVDLTSTGLLTAANVDINGGNIDNTVIGAAVPANGTFTNLVSNTSINTNGTFALDGVQGAVKELMIGQGVGTTPVWITVANLMEDLTAGAGLVGTNYDGSVARTFAVDYDATLKMDVAGDAGKIGLDLAHANSWTALQTFATVDINGGNIDATVIGEDTPAEAYFTELYSPLGTIDDLTSDNVDVTTSLTLEDAAEVLASNGTMTPSAGNPGDVFLSRGAGLSPEWTTEIPDLNILELTTEHFTVVDNTQEGPMTPYFEVPVDGERAAQFGGPGLGQEVDVTIYGKLTTNNLEVVETVPYLEIYDLNVTHNITLDGTIIGGDADFENLNADDIDAKMITTDRLVVNVDTYLTDVEAYGDAFFYGGLTVEGGDLIVNGGNDIIAKNNLEVHNAINNPTSTLGVQEPVLIDDTEGLNVPNGPVQAKRLALQVQKVTVIGDLPNAKAGIIAYSDVVNIAQTDLPTPSLDGEILYIVNKSSGSVTILGTVVAIDNIIGLVYVSGNWYVMP